jgi:phage terminase large subunit-like protein
MSKYYDELEKFERKYLNPWSGGRISGKNPNSLHISTDLEAKKAKTADFYENSAKIAEKIDKKQHSDLTLKDFAYLYGLPPSSTKSTESEEDITKALRHLESYEMKLPSSRRKRDPNAAFKTKKREKADAYLDELCDELLSKED